MRIKDYPKTLVIGDSVWELSFKKNLDDTRTTTTLGLCDPSERTLYIRLRQDPEQRLQTFIHEALHAIEFEYDFDMSHAIIHKLEVAISDFLIENGLINM